MKETTNPIYESEVNLQDGDVTETKEGTDNVLYEPAAEVLVENPIYQGVDDDDGDAIYTEPVE